MVDKNRGVIVIKMDTTVKMTGIRHEDRCNRNEDRC